MPQENKKRIGGFIIITSPKGEVLMLKRRNSLFVGRTKLYVEGTYELPGGTIEEGDTEEDPFTAAIREAYEETGNFVDRHKMYSAGVFENSKSRVYFFHYTAEQDEYDEFVSHTRNALKTLEKTNFKGNMPEEFQQLYEHCGVKSMKVWEIYALAREHHTLEPSQDFPKGLALHRMLTLAADVIVHTVLKHYGEQVMRELKENERKIITELKQELARETIGNVKSDLADLRKIARGETDFHGADGDLVINAEKGKAKFSYKG